MDLFDVLNLIGGLCLFLCGMNVMGQALERRAGNRLRELLDEELTARFFGGEGSHIVFPCDSSLIFS